MNTSVEHPMGNQKTSSSLRGIKYEPAASFEDNETLQPKQEFQKPDTAFLRFTVTTAVILYLVGGTTVVWPSPAVVMLKSNDSDVNPLERPITTLEISKLLGIPGMLGLFGSLLLPKLMDLFGPKKAMYTTGLAMFLGILGLAFGRSINTLVTFYSIATIAFYGIWGMLPIYILEICEDHNRAKYSCFMSGCITLGHLMSYVIGSGLSYTNFTLLTACPTILFLVLFLFVPESPVYSLSQGRELQCRQAIRKLRKNKSNVELENDFIKMKRSMNTIDNNNQIKLKTLFSKKEGRIGVMLTILPILVEYLSGVPTVMALLAPIFNESGSNLSGNTISIYVGLVKTTSYFSVSFIVEKTGRKPLLIFSAIGSGVAALMLGVFFYLKYINSPFVSQFRWIPLVCVSIYVLFFSLGIGPLPITIMSELFSSDLRPTASAFTLTLTNFCFSVYNFSYPIVTEAIGTHSCMWIFSGICFLGALLIFLFLPETRGKNIVEIQEMLKTYTIFPRFEENQLKNRASQI